MKNKKSLFSLFIVLLILSTFSTNIYANQVPGTLWETKTTDDPMKGWNVRFNYELNPNTVNNNNIFIKDVQGNLIESIVTLQKDKKMVAINPVNFICQ